MLKLPPLADDPLRERIRVLAATDEDSRVAALLDEAGLALGDGIGVVDTAAGLIEAIREQQRYRAGVTALLSEYSLSSREGVVLMCLAEALLRVPDSITADRLIRDKLGSGDWRAHVGNSQSLFVNASAWGLLLTGKVIQLRQEDSESAWRMLRQTVGRAGEPAIRNAMRLAMRIMGTQFVLGTDIDAALDKSREWQARGYRYSYDMLGEGARSMRYAADYFSSYYNAIDTVGRRSHSTDPVSGAGFSVKLSALHPRHELFQSQRLQHEIVPRVLQLAQLARSHSIGLTIDAEEANRLELTLGVFEAVYSDASLHGWEGMGIAVQAYQKNAPAVIDWLDALSARHGRRIMVRLVKGAYWDAEIKHAQTLGHAGYPVYTRKASTDVSYLVCAKRLLDRRTHLYPQFATHNAHSVAAVLAMCGKAEGFEFQRLHGMGEELYEELLERRNAGVSARIYAPVGVHRDLLAYLVRRLLENGANSSFVHNLANEELSSATLAADPRARLHGLRRFANASIPLPQTLFGSGRSNARGVDVLDVTELRAFARAISAWQPSATRLSAHAGNAADLAVINPADQRVLIGRYAASSREKTDAAMTRAHAFSASWAATAVPTRAACLRRSADLLEQATAELVGFCVKEAGKTVRDALADVREAIDFCRYYADEAEKLIAAHGNTLCPRGPILCISPWNFPVAIFVGQLSAALVTGNPVIAKPAEQTTLVAQRVLELFHAAGIPADALIGLFGPGEPIGTHLLPDARLAGVIFTGSTEVARHIATTLAARSGPRAMLIAETGGQNAMVVDSTALPEQVVDDVIASGFNSAGQRCSALRVLYVQEEIADRLIDLLCGAMRELRVGDPSDLATDVGPIIDNEACARLQAHVRYLDKRARLLHACELQAECANGSFFAPRLYEIKAIEDLPGEVFGPVVHVIRYRAADLEQLPQRINRAGYGLTFGIHSRIQSSIDLLARNVSVGNVYVNRNIIGAVVGVQPFGGQGLSGTGPKAGGPLYLGRLLQPRTGAGVADPRREPAAPTPLHLERAGACTALIEALAEAQEVWGATDMRTRFASARLLSEQLDPHLIPDHGTGARLRALLEQAGALSRALELPGPTGEMNTLSFVARGVLVCACRGGALQMDVLVPAVAALLSGNAVLFVSDNGARSLVIEARNLLADAGFADELTAHHSATEEAEIAVIVRECAIAGVLCHRDPTLAAGISRALAAREGAILPLLEEDFAPLYLQRLVHEKTVSVNTTASGGNAALMSQSESD